MKPWTRKRFRAAHSPQILDDKGKRVSIYPRAIVIIPLTAQEAGVRHGRDPEPYAGNCRRHCRLQLS